MPIAAKSAEYVVRLTALPSHSSHPLGGAILLLPPIIPP
jgi:hypothetical protein